MSKIALCGILEDGTQLLILPGSDQYSTDCIEFDDGVVLSPVVRANVLLYVDKAFILTGIAGRMPNGLVVIAVSVDDNFDSIESEIPYNGIITLNPFAEDNVVQVYDAVIFKEC